MNKKKLIIFLVLGLIGAAGGVALQSLMGQNKAAATTEEGGDGHGETPAAAADPHAADAKAADSHGGGGGGGGHGAPGGGKVDPLQQEGYLMFDRMVLNLNDPALIKYLTVEVVLVVDPTDWSEVKGKLERKKPQLKDRLVTLVADKTLDDVQGKVGINRLKREINDEFNRILFPEGVRRIQDVYFDEWHIEE